MTEVLEEVVVAVDVYADGGGGGARGVAVLAPEGVSVLVKVDAVGVDRGGSDADGGGSQDVRIEIGACAVDETSSWSSNRLQAIETGSLERCKLYSIIVALFELSWSLSDHPKRQK
ncbi:MAG: hypothetical protein M1839_007623 [Geoglossum umbratile]|nr:MAG: hypothetical protein M1839_007623 [Geoglossum umbratile]